MLYKKLALSLLLIPGYMVAVVPSPNTRSEAVIKVKEELLGIRGLLETYPKTGEPLKQLAQVLLRGESTLSSGERELIAVHVSNLNECNFCCNSHGAAATALHNGNKEVVAAVIKGDFEHASITPKMKRLLGLAGKVQNDARSVNAYDIAQARAAGATDDEINHTVLIAAAFCMYNRYVDALTAGTSTHEAAYFAMGQQLAQQGYIRK